MTNLNLYTSNRLEILAEKLAEVLSAPLFSPMATEIVVVQSKGMERWLSMAIARRFGICANVRFPFPNAFIYELIGKVISNLPDPSPFDPKFLTWKIFKTLPTLINMPGFESIKKYLDKGGFDLKGLQLAERLADLFDQYLLYRPDWIFRWEKGEELHWQAVLWRSLVNGNEYIHRAALGKRFVEHLQQTDFQQDNFPQRIAVFGISSLPVFHIQILASISKFTEVNLFLMNPCREFWFDILSDQEIKRVTVQHHELKTAEEALYAEKGNSLLASMGTQGRDFLAMIYDFDIQEQSDFEAPGRGKLLFHIQSDILDLKDREKISSKILLSETDDSIQIHSCHSPMREIEVLQDQLLKLFEQNPELLPKNILVMAPDIEIYAPFIQAVFDLPQDDPRRIPFSITDRNVRNENQVVEAFFAMLDLLGSRFGAARVMNILEYPSVRLKFEISESEVDLIKQWIADTQIRWGIDKNNRRELDLPAITENTWQSGLDRLLLGYAMTGENEKLFADILPYDHIEGGEAVVLGNFIEFTDRLFKTVSSMEQIRTLQQWSDFFHSLVEQFFESGEDTQNHLMMIWQAFNELTIIQDESGFTEKIDIQIIRNYLEHQLEKTSSGYGFMTGGITFCSMLPMRSIPFKVICLIGMNDNAYPRPEKKLSFDLMVKHPRPGDRSRRKDDRYLFLEALLSAREKLYISYVGQSIQDNSVIPPSVLVSELLDYIHSYFEMPGKNITATLIIKHRLQAFSPEYFKGLPELFNYSFEHFQSAKKLLEPRQSPIAFLPTGIKTPTAEWKKVAISDLCNFLFNPAKYLLTKRLRIQLEEDILILDETEPFNIEHLDQYLLEQQLVAKQLNDRNLKEFLKATRAAGRLPHGTVGDCIYERLIRGVERFVQQIRPYIPAKPLAPLNVDLNIADFNLVGSIDGIYPERLVRYRYAKIRSKDRLHIWIYHLILSSVEVENYPQNSLLIGLNPELREPQRIAWQFSKLENSRELLNRLLEIYWHSLQQPIHFFPESSWEYANQIVAKNKTPQDALNSAQKVWLGSDYSRGECEDYYYQLCYRDINPLTDEFQSLAMEIFRPIIESQQQIY